MQKYCIVRERHGAFYLYEETFTIKEQAITFVKEKAKAEFGTKYIVMAPVYSCLNKPNPSLEEEYYRG